ncbi:hypothetical protein QUA13_20485 [Microcoleus sp. S28C3]|uniref:hypothetical protein n=1 Tax=Microcoleus sp. S28C3 TaxID=3055414 RepID=UPI002FCF0EC5
MLPLIFDTCVPRDEILSGDLSLDLFAAKLRLVVEGNAPQVYQNAKTRMKWRCARSILRKRR